MHAKGFYFDGLSSQRHDAQLGLDADDNWCLQYGQTIRSYSPAEVQVGSRLGNSARTVNFADGGHFASDEHAALDLMVRHLHGAGQGTLHRLESSWKWILTSAVVLLLALYLGLTKGVPLAARGIVAVLPPGIEAHIGRQTLQLLDDYVLDPSQLSAERQQQLQQHFAPMLAAHPELNLRVHFRHAGIGPNAFALPGGDLVFLDDIVELAADDDELSAVLAHEIGHVAGHHGMRRIVQNGLLYWGMMAITGDISAASDTLAGAPAYLMNMAYSRDMESEADDFALQQLHHQGIAPVHFANIMRRLDTAAASEEPARRTEKLLHMLSSHPDTRERVRKFE